MQDILTDSVKEIKGTVERITYRNEGNSYTVAEVKADGKSQTVVGILPFLTEGDEAVFYGEYTVHPSYGEQFKAEHFERKAPQNSASILRYLSSGAIRGIGPATAQKIVEKFGADTLDVIQNRPEDLATIKGITLSKAKQLSEEYQKQYGVRDIMMMLSKYGATPDKCLAVYRRFGDKSTDMIKSNPYALCEEGIDFRFETAEDIAEDMSFDKNSELRVSAGVEYVLRKNLANGHTCLPREKLCEVAVRLLECKRDTVEDCCDRLTECFRIKSKTVNGTEYLSIPEYFSAEEHIAARLISVKRYIDKAVTVDKLEIENVERRLGIEFEDLQKQAIFEAFSSGILVLTGGPGTGKTTTLNAIISLFENRSLDIELAAPTGRAAKRMTELTGREAKTIHRLLEVEWGEGDKQQFSRNERNPLNCDVIIVDEASMIDALLFDSLLKALRLSCRIILVGDSDQLPAVGAGNVLNDILSSEIFPSIRLKKVFRQAGKSKIVTNAHAIINGESPDFSSNESDCFFLRRQDRFAVCNTVLELVSERLPNAYGFDPIRDIQVLCPSRMTETGTVNLNNILQSALNPSTSGKQQLSFKGIYLREGDKVMQIKNDYEIDWELKNKYKVTYEHGKGVFNGDCGIVNRINLATEYVEVIFDDNKYVTYTFKQLEELELAYAITIHMSQGSEYPAVIMPMYPAPKMLMNRNLLYTAVTRAKQCVCLVGLPESFETMLYNKNEQLRYSGLKDRICELEENDRD